MPRWCMISALGVGLSVAGCHSAGTSGQEDLGRGIVQGTLGAQLAGDARAPLPAHTVSFTGHVTAVEGGAYVIQDVGGNERRVAHDENTRIDRPAHVGDQVEIFVDHRSRAVFIRNIDGDERFR